MPMAKDQFKREVDYGLLMMLTQEMLERGVIDRREYSRADKMYTERFNPIFKRREPQGNNGYSPN